MVGLISLVYWSELSSLPCDVCHQIGQYNKYNQLLMSMIITIRAVCIEGVRVDSIVAH